MYYNIFLLVLLNIFYQINLLEKHMEFLIIKLLLLNHKLFQNHMKNTFYLDQIGSTFGTFSAHSGPVITSIILQKSRKDLLLVGFVNASNGSAA